MDTIILAIGLLLCLAVIVFLYLDIQDEADDPIVKWLDEIAQGTGEGGGMSELALFAGAGGGLLATHHLLGWRCVGYVEMAEYPCKVLEARINDGLLSKAPIYQMHTRDFIRLGIAEKYRGVAQVITAGFPCQPFSVAGLGLADKDPRNGWPDTIAIIRIVRPQYILLENVSKLVSSPYFGVILSDLAQSGYDCRWDCVPASAVGAPHQRDRVWIIGWNVADAPGGYGGCVQRSDTSQKPLHTPQREKGPFEANGSGEVMAYTDQERRDGRTGSFGQAGGIKSENGGQMGDPVRQGLAHGEGERANPHQKQQAAIRASGQIGEWWATEPELGRVVNGLAHRVDRLTAIGNGQVPGVVAEVWRVLGF